MNDIGVAASGSPEGAAHPEGGAHVEGASRAEAAELLAAISAVRRTTRRAVRHAWATPPLPTAQSELLRLIARRPGLCVADAAHELRLAPNTVSTLVGRLAEQDLLRRERSLPDSRSVRLTITDKARRRLEEWRDLRAELASEVLAAMPAGDRRALAGAVPAMIRLAERMEDR
ncbi:MAG TPA: MarR family winged helix-turn-helix transcriptional regulator [Streptosporangiaceae bacterium]